LFRWEQYIKEYIMSVETKIIELNGATYKIETCFNFVCIDNDGAVWAYEYKPKYDDEEGIWVCITGRATRVYAINHTTNYKEI